MVPLSILVTVIFWSLLSNLVLHTNDVYNRDTGVISHIVNLGFPLIELFTTLVDPPWIYGLGSFVVLFFYAVMIVIVHAVSNMDWPYSFLDTLNAGKEGVRWGPMLGFVAAMFVLLYILFAITIGLIRLRNIFVRRRFQNLKEEIYTESPLKDDTNDQESEPLERLNTEVPLRQRE
ncbi:hypothetical protein HDV01_004335 [Terramyces sp. JEL0728]|nr:hypothetical protein HDV01_004335 [Terramyces sp. JEL0728]